MDLGVDASLDDTNRDLKAIHQEFSDAQKNADDDTTIWGQQDLADAMMKFVNDWYVHRDKIDGRLKSLSDKVDQAVSTWSDTEKKLSDSLSTDSSSTSDSSAGSAVASGVSSV